MKYFVIRHKVTQTLMPMEHPTMWVPGELHFGQASYTPRLYRRPDKARRALKEWAEAENKSYSMRLATDLEIVPVYLQFGEPL